MSFSSHKKGLKKLVSIGCMLLAVLLLLPPTYADLTNAGRKSGLIYYKLDPSAIEYGYAPHFKAAAEEWNGITSKVQLKAFEEGSNAMPDVYCVSNSRIEGLLGAHQPYTNTLMGKIRPAADNEKWVFSAIMIYHNNMNLHRLTYKEKISNAAHEIGHTLSLTHPLGIEPSIMRQGIQAIAPTSYDRFELRRKWDLKTTSLPEYKHNIIHVSANYQHYDEVDLADQSADLILLAQPTVPFEKRKATIRQTDHGIITDFYTQTTLNIEKVLKADPAAPQKENTQVQVLEPTALGQADGKAVLYQYEGYSAMEVDSSYIVFLKRNSYGDYSVINMSLGRIDLQANQPALPREIGPLLKAPGPTDSTESADATVTTVETESLEKTFIEEAIKKYIH